MKRVTNIVNLAAIQFWGVVWHRQCVSHKVRRRRHADRCFRTHQELWNACSFVVIGQLQEKTLSNPVMQIHVTYQNLTDQNLPCVEKYQRVWKVWVLRGGRCHWLRNLGQCSTVCSVKRLVRFVLQRGWRWAWGLADLVLQCSSVF